MKMHLPDLVGLPCPRCGSGKIVEHQRISRRVRDSSDLVSLLVSVCCYSCTFYINPTWGGAPGFGEPTAHERIALAKSLASARASLPAGPDVQSETLE